MSLSLLPFFFLFYLYIHNVEKKNLDKIDRIAKITINDLAVLVILVIFLKDWMVLLGLCILALKRPKLICQNNENRFPKILPHFIIIKELMMLNIYLRKYSLNIVIHIIRTLLHRANNHWCGNCYVIVFIVSYREITNSRFSLTQSKPYIF